MFIKPLGDRIVVRVVDEEKITSGGIHLPDIAAKKSQEAEVVTVGPGSLNAKGERIPMGILVGDRVVFVRYAGTEIEREEETYLVLRENDILAVITKERTKART